jgi:endonuclease/exonuclease/phosphatase family metal-dependent hydrolase
MGWPSTLKTFATGSTKACLNRKQNFAPTTFHRRTEAHGLDYVWFSASITPRLRDARHHHETRTPAISDHAALSVNLTIR